MDKLNNTPPPWSEAPPWAMWRAQDENGRWYWYEIEPEQHTNGVEFRSIGNYELAAVPSNPDWKTTLQKRPENE